MKRTVVNLLAANNNVTEGSISRNGGWHRHVVSLTCHPALTRHVTLRPTLNGLTTTQLTHSDLMKIKEKDFWTKLNYLIVIQIVVYLL